MKEYTVICWASEEVSVDAENEEEAKELAAEKCRFPYVDYCDAYEN